MEQVIKIIAEPQMDPHQCKFILEKSLVQGGSFSFKNKEEATGSPLPEALFKIPAVSEVLVSEKIITVRKSSDLDWRTLGREIGATIRGALMAHENLISEEAKKRLPPPDEIRKKVLNILETQVNPAVASHGGYIELLDVKYNDIYIKMGGGCQGCASSTATLKQGVEQSLRKEIPELGSIYDTTDHAGGTNPYYSH